MTRQPHPAELDFTIPTAEELPSSLDIQETNSAAIILHNSAGAEFAGWESGSDDAGAHFKKAPETKGGIVPEELHIGLKDDSSHGTDLRWIRRFETEIGHSDVTAKYSLLPGREAADQPVVGIEHNTFERIRGVSIETRVPTTAIQGLTENALSGVSQAMKEISEAKVDDADTAPTMPSHPVLGLLGKLAARVMPSASRR